MRVINLISISIKKNLWYNGSIIQFFKKEKIMSKYRSKSRELVLQLLFSLSFFDQRDRSIKNIIDDFENDFKDDEDFEIKYLDKEFCLKAITGIEENKLEIDELIRSKLKRWKLERLPKIDLSILRLATYEMKYEGLDPRIAINEAIILSKKYCSDKSPSYINGVLDSIKVEIKGGS